MLRSVFIPLVKKDIYILRTQIFSYGALGVFSFFVMIAPSKSLNFLGMMLLVTAIIALYCHICVKSLALEKKDNTHLFLLTLPVSVRALYWVKFISLTAVFLGVWGGLFALVQAFLFWNGQWPAIMPSFVTALFFLYVPAFFFILFVGVVKGTEGWTILAMVASNITVTILSTHIHSIPLIHDSFEAGRISEIGVLWPSVISQILGWELGIAIILLVCIFISISRKSEYV